jgi:hypothetical protein
MDRSKPVKRKTRKTRKTQEKQVIKQVIKESIKKTAPSTPEVLKKIEKLPPKKRKAYLRRVVLSFAKGAAVTAGVIVTAGVFYKIGGRKFIKSETNYMTNELGRQVQTQLNGIKNGLDDQLGATIDQLGPATDHVIQQGIDKAIAGVQAKQGEINKIASETTKSALQGVQENVGGVGSWLLGKPTAPKTKPNHEKKYTRINQQVDPNNIIDTKRSRTPTKTFDPSAGPSPKSTPSGKSKRLEEIDKRIEEIDKEIEQIINIEYNQEIQDTDLPIRLNNLRKERAELLTKQKSNSFGKIKILLKLKLRKLKSDLKKLK